MVFGLMSWSHSPDARAAAAPTPLRIFGTVVLLLAPSDIGVLSSEDGVDLALGWSGQLPIGRPHRIVAGFDLNPTSEHHFARARLGYRYAWRYPFIGGGVTFDGSGTTVSPEIGIRFLHSEPSVGEANPALHLLTRFDLMPLTDVQAVTVLFGWTWF